MTGTQNLIVAIGSIFLHAAINTALDGIQSFLQILYIIVEKTLHKIENHKPYVVTRILQGLTFQLFSGTNKSGEHPWSF